MSDPPIYWNRWEAMKTNYNFTCPCCGRSEPEIKLTKDHVVPFALGGAKGYKNLQPLCVECNHIKSGNHPTAYPIKRVGEVILLPASRLLPQPSRAEKMSGRLKLYARLNKQILEVQRQQKNLPKKKRKHRFGVGFFTQRSGQQMPNQDLLDRLADMGLILQTYRSPKLTIERQDVMFPQQNAQSPATGRLSQPDLVVGRVNGIYNLIETLTERLRPVLAEVPVQSGAPVNSDSTPILRDLDSIQYRLEELLSRVGI